MVPLIDWHTIGRTRCAAVDLSDSSTAVPITHHAQSGDMWCTLLGHTAPHHMDRNEHRQFLMDQHAADREEAHENACEAYHAIEALQRCDTWQELPIGVRRLLCASHAALGALADGLC